MGFQLLDDASWVNHEPRRHASVSETFLAFGPGFGEHTTLVFPEAKGHRPGGWGTRSPRARERDGEWRPFLFAETAGIGIFFVRENLLDFEPEDSLNLPRIVNPLLTSS